MPTTLISYIVIRMLWLGSLNQNQSFINRHEYNSDGCSRQPLTWCVVG